MTNKRTTKQALVASAILLCMSFTMLLGTTFAWFTDSATSAGNKIVAGTLDVQLLMYNGTEYVNIGDSKAPIFGEGSLAQNNNAETLWEPGKTQVAYLAIKNNGNLDLKYQVAINVRDDEDDKDLYKVLKYDIIEGKENGVGVTEWSYADAKTVDVGNNIDTDDVFLKAHTDHYFALAVHMDEEAGNEYQGGYVNFDIKVLATQVASEKDSFDNQYDNGAGYYPNSSAPEEVPDDTTETLVLISDKDAKVTIPAAIVSGSEQVSLNHTDVVADGANGTVTIEGMELLDQDGNVIDLSANTTPFDVLLPAQNAIPAGESVLVYHDGEYVGIGKVNADGTISYKATHFCEILVKSAEGALVIVDGKAYDSVTDAIANAEDGATIEMISGTNTTDEPITESIVVDKEITLVPNGMYLVSEAPATFTVAEGGKLTVAEGSFTIKNTASNGACVLVDGGEIVMAGGSFDGHTAVRTTEGKSSTVTLAAGWSNRVTVGFDLKGDDTLNVTGGTLISSQESIIANGKFTLNMSGGTLSGKPARQNQYNPSVVCNGEALINMTGGKIETTANQSIAVCAKNDSVINLSGDAVISGTNAGIRFGDFSGRNPGDNNVLNISGNAKVTANGAGNNWKIGFAIQANATNTIINVSGNAVINGSSYGILAGQDGCAVTVSDNVTITSTTGSEGYGIGAPNITITGGTIIAKNYGVISDMANSVVVIDNSTTKSPINISGGTYDVYVHATSDYTCAGDPVFDTFGERS